MKCGERVSRASEEVKRSGKEELNTAGERGAPGSENLTPFLC